MANNTQRAGNSRDQAFTNPNGFSPLGAHINKAATTLASAFLVDPTTINLASDDLEDQVNAVLIQAGNRDIRYTLDGTTPTASVGFVLTAGAPPVLIYWAPNVVLRIIETAVSATADIQFGSVWGGD